MSKSEKIIRTCESGLAMADALANKLGLNLFAVDVGPASRVEVWNKNWTRRLATGSHVSRYPL